MDKVKNSLKNLSENSREALKAMSDAINQTAAANITVPRDTPQRYRSWEEMMRERQQSLAKYFFSDDYDNLSEKNKEFIDSKIKNEKGYPEEKAEMSLERAATEAAEHAAALTNTARVKNTRPLINIDYEEEKEDDEFCI